MRADPRFAEFFARLQDLLTFLLPATVDEGKAHLTIGFGCTGSSYVVGTATQLPAKPGGGGCCGGPNNKCAANPAGFAADAIWKQLDFQIDEPTLFYYDYTGTATTFTAKATGDLDCDNTEIVYQLDGTATNGNPAVNLTEPPPNSD